MMYVFPVLTTPNISKNILTTICRTLEHYLIVYHTNDILEGIYQQTDTRITVKQNRLMNITHEQASGGKGAAVDPDDEDEDEELKTQRRSDNKPPQIKIDMPKPDALSLEPTYMTVDHPKIGKQMLAVKAIPFTVKSPEMMLSLLVDDYSAFFAVRWLRQIDRALVRGIWKLIRAFIPFSSIRDRAITGDVQKDVIYGFSKHSSRGKDVFVLFDKNEVTTEIANDAQKVKRLFSMYWPSFVVVDDVEKTATFCMEGFNGLCSTIQYPYLVTSIGKEHKKVYDDLEEVRKASSQFFRLTTNKKKVLECSCFAEKDKQLNELTRGGREVLIEDDVLPIINRLTDPAKTDKIFAKLKLSLQTKEDQLAIKTLENIPTLSIESIEKFAKKASPDFVSLYDKVQTILTNSTKIPEELIKPISLMLTIHSTYKNVNAKKSVKENLLTFVPLIRKSKINQFPTRACVRVFLNTLAGSDKAGLAAGLLILKICLNSTNEQLTKEEPNDGSEV